MLPSEGSLSSPHAAKIARTSNHEWRRRPLDIRRTEAVMSKSIFIMRASVALSLRYSSDMETLKRRRLWKPVIIGAILLLTALTFYEIVTRLTA
jgi:hypothetical protein